MVQVTPWDHALAILMPRHCPGCGGEEGVHGAGLCSGCRLQVGWALEAVLAPDHVDQAWTLGAYRGLLGDMVRQAKYGRDLALCDAIGCWMAEASSGLPDVDVVVSITAPWWRTLRRGQDVPPRLAAPIADAVGVPVGKLLRQHGRRSQVGMGRADRLANTEDRFYAICAAPRRILLVDDVQTTGATLSACSRVLRDSGAVWVGALTAVVRQRDGVKKS
jgi:predicted amidophosphoribosyltransferase